MPRAGWWFAATIIKTKLRSPSSFATSQIVTVFVGPGRRPFYLHKDLLLQKCPFFEKCLKDSSNAGHENEVPLAEDSSVAWARFSDWMYRDEIIELEDEEENNVLSFARTYVLADKFCMTSFKNAIVDACRAYARRWVIWPTTLAYLHEKGPPNSKLRQFLMDQLVYNLVEHNEFYYGDKAKDSGTKKSMDEFMRKGGDLPAEVMWAVGAAKKRGNSDPSKRKGCQYHDITDNRIICGCAGVKDE